MVKRAVLLYAIMQMWCRITGTQGCSVCKRDEKLSNVDRQAVAQIQQTEERKVNRIRNMTRVGQLTVAVAERDHVLIIFLH